MPDPDARSLEDRPTHDVRTPDERARADERARFADHTTLDSGGEPRPIVAELPLPEAAPAGAGRYVTGEEIARGGMGRVVAATDAVLGRVVAVKEALTTDPDTLRRFARETQITARLEHPAIVPVYDAGRGPDGAPYYVMRRVSGQPLDRLVDRTTTLAERLALLPHVVAAAQAVAHAHRRGVLHRDLKPANILVGEHGETVVIDWGLAKVTDEPDDPAVAPLQVADDRALTRAGAVFGTPGFMSPEQVSGAVVDARGDVYALGATLYFVLANRPPHAAESGKAMMALAAKQPPEPIARLVPGVPRDLAWIVDTALAFRPEDRYPHAGALAAELKDFLTGQLVASRHYTPLERLVRFVRRHRIAAFTAAAALIALAVVGAISGARVLAERANTAAALATALREKRQADEALVEMTLNQARTLLATNPTAAIAVARPLAGSARWREVRAIGAAARAAGACTGLPGPLRPIGIVLAPGGRAATTSDMDGTIWFHDLARRTSRTVLRLAPRYGRAVFAGDDRLVVHDQQRLAVVDLASGAIRELPPGRGLRHANATAAAVFAVGEDGTLHRLELDGSRTTRLDAAGVQRVEPSPDGRTLAAETETGLLLVDATGTAPSIRIGTAPAFDVRWDPSSSALSMRHGEEAVLVTLQPAPAIAARRGIRGFVPHLPLRGNLMVLTPAGLEQVGGGALYGAPAPVDLQIHRTRGDAVVIARRGGLVSILHEHVVVELRAPSDELLQLAASPGSPYVVAATRGRLLVWDADAVLPTAARIETAEQVVPIAGHRLLLGMADGRWRWRDLATGHETPFRIPPGMYHPISDGRDDLVVLRYDAQAGRRGFLIARYGERPHAVDLEASVIIVHAGRVIAGTPAGDVIELDPATRTRTVLASRPAGAPAAVASLGARDGWRAARWADGRAWRRGPGGREELGTLVAGAPAQLLLLQTSEGRTCAATGPRLECWDADGQTATRATMSLDIRWTELLEDGRAIVALADLGVYRIELATGAATSVAASGGVAQSVARAPGLAVVRRADNRLTVIDFLADAAWPLMAGFTSSAGDPQLTADGTLITAVARMSNLLTWRLDLPPTPEATARWLDELTNATVEHGSNKPGWR